MSVTQKAVFALPNGIHRVEDCLYLRVQDSGRSFIFRYMKDGKRRDIGVGSVQKVSVAQAKGIAAKYRAEIAAGRDPKPKKEKPKAIRTFRVVSLEAFENTKEVKRWKTETLGKRWLAVLNTYAMPTLGDMLISDIKRQNIIDVLNPIWTQKNPTATKLRMILERVFSYAIFAGDYEGANPAVYKGNIDIVLPSPAKIHKQEHHKAMSLSQLKETLIKAIEEHTPISLAAAMIALTGLRVSEVSRALWGEVNLENKVFSIPAERRKVAREYPHRVPITRQMEIIFNELKGLRVSDYVFPSTQKENITFVPRYVAIYLKKASGVEEATAHGCRSIFRVWAEETGQNTTAAEYQMMHENPSAVVRAYQRSDLLEQRRELMQRWADEVLPMDVLMKALGAKP